VRLAAGRAAMVEGTASQESHAVQDVASLLVSCVRWTMGQGRRVSPVSPVGRYKPWALDVWEARLRPLSCHGLCTEGASRKALLPCMLDMSMHWQAVDRWLLDGFQSVDYRAAAD
jgi:hypothetical protein